MVPQIKKYRITQLADTTADDRNPDTPFWNGGKYLSCKVMVGGCQVTEIGWAYHAMEIKSSGKRSQLMIEKFSVPSTCFLPFFGYGNLFLSIFDWAFRLTLSSRICFISWCCLFCFVLFFVFIFLDTPLLFPPFFSFSVFLFFFLIFTIFPLFLLLFLLLLFRCVHASL